MASPPMPGPVPATALEGILARIALGLHARGVRRIIVSGGATSSAVLAALKVEALEVDSYVTAGQSYAMTRGADPISPSTSSPASSDLSRCWSE
jgi:uncharacterized protein YgbK (DUF1537 family)